MSEAQVQQDLRLLAAQHGGSLWRNNMGACRDDTGRMIRYGLGNDSKKLNEVWKSSDLIGITPVTVMPHHIGQRLGIFTAVEVKHPTWRGPSNARELAQRNFILDVTRMGGIGIFATSKEDYINGTTRP